MSVEIENASTGLLTVKISGWLAYPELVAIQQAMAEMIQKYGKVRVLTIAENFQGWERGGDWGDVSFQMTYDAYIERIAIVGEKRWEELALVFISKGFRSFPIEYFAPTHLAAANAWLQQ